MKKAMKEIPGFLAIQGGRYVVPPEVRVFYTTMMSPEAKARGKDTFLRRVAEMRPRVR
ncbi:MAG: hypothetical protein WCT01_04010 [Candidatus Shapirobacteria bacterium]